MSRFLGCLNDAFISYVLYFPKVVGQFTQVYRNLMRIVHARIRNEELIVKGNDSLPPHKAT